MARLPELSSRPALKKKGNLQKYISINDLVQLSGEIPLLDARTPSEYLSGHIPRAVNFPLFFDEERIVIGTLYKQQGREAAILKGLEIIGPRMRPIVEDALKLAPERKVILHCWRGGMRSGSLAWLLDLYGFDVFIIKGGYKQYRRWAFRQFEKEYNLLILGGKTGSRKTEVLAELSAKGEQAIDLEGLAHHKGSAFGGIGQAPAPTQEQFENDLALQLSGIDIQKPLWLEDESRLIGRKVIPDGLWEQMRSARVVFLDIPAEYRAVYLAETYGKMDKEELSASILSIQKRLGGLDTKLALQALENNDLIETALILLRYYDKAYLHGLSKREAEKVVRVVPEEFIPDKMAKEILKSCGKFNP
jgi:tRNA 2-selenouridine synthase